MQQQGIVRGDTLQRIASIGLIVGAILLAISSLLFPSEAHPGTLQDALRTVGEQRVLTQICALLLAVGFWLVMLGLAGVYRSISAGAGAAWVRLGFYGIVVGTAMWTITSGLVMGCAGVAANWIAALPSEQATAYSLVVAVNAVAEAVGTMTIIIFWLALVLLGIGMVLSVVYPKWIGYAGIVLGIATVAGGGIVPAFAEPSTTLDIVFMILSLLTIAWMLAVGIWVARKAW